MDWKEDLVLQFRELTIDKGLISRGMQNFVNEFNKNLDKYTIDDVEATTDSSEFINIKSYRNIKIMYGENTVTFVLYDINGSNYEVYIKLSIKVGKYFIRYINMEERNPKLLSFIDEKTIDGIFEDLFDLNRQIIGM